VSGFDDPAFSGDRWAATYQDLTSRGPDPTAAVEFLAGLVPEGARILELAIGGGRVALPLARRGFRLEGIEASAAVAERLRAAPGGRDIPVLVDDMADVAVSGEFALVYVVWNSLFNLTRQQRQVECFANVARVLTDGGLFVVECFVPDQGEFAEGVHPRHLSEDSATLTITQHDRLEQRLTRQHLTVTSAGIRLLPVALRYCWPSELDLMARLAGLRLRERFGDWNRAPFEAASTKHVSVYERPAADAAGSP
jgi:SAM-dependent methyltransferase